jgi:hypothetical protein
MTNKLQSEDNSEPLPERQAEATSEELTADQLDSVAGAAPAPSSTSLFSPASGDEVVVSFTQDSPRQPVIIGGLWNGGSKPPETSG